MMNRKRRRGEPSAGSPLRKAGSANGDIFDEVMRQRRAEAATTPLHQSWFSSSSAVATFRWDEDQQEVICDADDEDSSYETLREEIEALQGRLTAVKGRLGPAAEELCAAAAAAAGISSPRRPGDGSTSHGPRGAFAEARRACNPFEKLGEGRDGGLNTLFVNRSAIKLANVDAILDFRLTCVPAIENGNDDNEVGGEKHYRFDGGGGSPRSRCFRFVDLCGAPGGFSECLLRRCAQSGAIAACSGYGMSLLGRNGDGRGLHWKLRENQSYVKNGTRVRYRLSPGADGTGDILKWENVESLREMVLENDEGGSSCQVSAGYGEDVSRGVHLVVADGGFDAQRDAENQEELTQKLVVAQAAAAMELLEAGGTFLIKMFGFRTPVIREMVRDVAARFDTVAILKPVSSRPASAERYVVFSGFDVARRARGAGSENGKWDGRLWQKRIVETASISEKTPCSRAPGSPNAKRLFRFLDEFDRDMLSLNLKACSSILSHLERRVRAVHEEEKPGRRATCSPRETAFTVDVQAYKNAWCLS